MEANAEACEASVEKSLSMVTSLNPHIGYEKAAAMAKEAFKTRQDDPRAVPRAEGILPEATLNEALDPMEHDRAALTGCQTKDYRLPENAISDRLSHARSTLARLRERVATKSRGEG